MWLPDSMQRMATVVQTKFKWEKRCEPFLSGRHEQTVRRAKREAQAFPETCSQERRRWKWSWPWRTFEWRDQPTISSFLFIKCLGGVLRLPLQCLFPLLCPFIKNQVLKQKVLEKSQLVVEDYKWIHIKTKPFPMLWHGAAGLGYLKGGRIHFF